MKRVNSAYKEFSNIDARGEQAIYCSTFTSKRSAIISLLNLQTV